MISQSLYRYLFTKSRGIPGREEHAPALGMTHWAVTVPLDFRILFILVVGGGFEGGVAGIDHQSPDEDDKDDNYDNNRAIKEERAKWVESGP